MTLEEAILHAQQKADELGCTECAKDHHQLAEWLQELVDIRKSTSNMIDFDEACEWLKNHAEDYTEPIGGGIDTIKMLWDFSKDVKNKGYYI